MGAVTRRQFTERLMTSRRENILETAHTLVSGDREAVYGAPADNFGLIAKYWATYLSRDISANDVCSMMELLKIARRKSNTRYADNYIDAAGYAALAYEVCDND